MNTPECRAAEILARLDERAKQRHYHDNEWSDNLHLADVVDKHLHRHLAYAPLADDARARAIEERLGRVIPGPWSSASDDACPAVTSHGRIIAQCTNYTVAALIAHAPDDLAYLLGRVRALTAEVARAREERAHINVDLLKMAAAGMCRCVEVGELSAAERGNVCNGECARALARQVLRLED